MKIMINFNNNNNIYIGLKFKEEIKKNTDKLLLKSFLVLNIEFLQVISLERF